MTDTSTTRRTGGRAARHAKRAVPVSVNPAPAGAAGGAYKALSELELQQIFDTALRLLAELGMGQVPDRLAKDLIAAGGVDLGNKRISLPIEMVKGTIETSAKEFWLYGRDPSRDIHVGGDRVYFGTGGAAVTTLDLETERYRPSTLQDLHDFTRLQDTLDNVAWFTRCCIATDISDMYDLDVNTAYALMRNTNKPVATAFTVAEHVDPIVKMFDIVAGGKGEFAKCPFVKAHIKRWSRKFGPVVKVDRMKKVMIQKDKKKEPSARLQSQGCA